jgi:methyl-accepting chemotaxis protein
MPSQKIPFTKGLVGRMFLVGALPTLILLAAVITINTRRTFRSAIEALENQIQAEVALAAAEIEDGNSNATIAAQHMAEAQVAGMFGDRTTSLAFARAVLADSPAYTGAYFGYEPDADGQDAAQLAGDDIPREAMGGTGRFIPYWFVDSKNGGSIELTPLVDMETSLYYDGVKDAFASTGKAAPMVTEPYVYEGKMIVEQTYPLVIDGKFVGVAGVDRALTDLDQTLKRLAQRVDAEAFLISGRGSFIAATTDRGETDDDLKTRRVADTAYASLFGEFLRDTTRDVSVAEGEDPSTEEHHYYAVARIPTGGWTLVLSRSEADVLAPIKAAIAKNLILAIAAVLFIIAVLLGSAVIVSRRINRAVDAAERVAGGDLTGSETSTGADETGQLLRTINGMTTNLNGLVGQVKQSSIQLNSTATEVAATSREQEATAKSFGAATSQVAAAAKQISATSGELVQTIDRVDEVATGTAALAGEGRTGLDTMHGTMHELDAATRSIADKLAVINEKAARITGVVTTINKVAEQTNLLSVNAAIEAEKAGEYGQGFLVVAREIRRLADQTGAATLDIEQMVQQMQSAVSTGVMEMDRFADQVRHGVASVGQISTQMGEIIENVNNNTSSFKLVNEGMRSQSQGAQQISEAMIQLTPTRSAPRRPSANTVRRPSSSTGPWPSCARRSRRSSSSRSDRRCTS